MQNKTPRQVIIDLFNDILGAPSVDISAVQKYVDPAYVQHVDGVTLDYPGFIEHLRKQKQVIDSMTVEFLAMVEDGETVFTNHIVTAAKKDGSRIRAKVMAQFTVRDGRVIGCDELTQLLSGNPEDRDLGSRH
ncbi:MAG: nuclear transport factor 2 family protein [Candidatus Accumulibacter sp.]|nr:nuclear transport factor 2 family protein [Accumulibacter sp.]